MLEGKREKILLIIAFLFLTSFILIIPDVNSQSLSIYDNISVSLYLILFISLFIGIYISHISFLKNKTNFILSSLLIVLINFTILALPLLFNYLSYGLYDQLSYIGQIKTIINTHATGINNFYPLIHILSYEIISILNIDIFLITMVIPPILSILFILYIYLFVNNFYTDMLHKWYIFILGSMFILGSYHSLIAPNGFALFMLPLIFYIFMKLNKTDKQTHYTLLLILLFFTLVLAHILVAIFLLIIISIIYLIQYIKRCDISPEAAIIKSKNSMLLLFITILIWFCSTYLFSRSVLLTWDWLKGEIFGSPIDRTIYLMNRPVLSIQDNIYILINYIGFLIILIVPIIIYIFHILIKKIKIKNRNAIAIYLFIYTIPILIIFSFSPLFPDYSRIIKFTIPIILFISGYSFSYIYNQFNNKKWRSLIAIILIVVPCVLCAFNVHPDPRTMDVNQRVFKNDLIGIEFLIDEYNFSGNIQSISRVDRLFHPLIGYDETTTVLQNYYYQYPGNHFSDLNNNSANDILYITERDRKISTELYEGYRYSNEDFISIEIADDVDKIYSTSYSQIYYIL